ncbi:MAG: transaldolase family protein, partial [Planctomycetota bacterium]
MSDGFFARVHAQTPTRVWINNPTPDQARAAIVYGARNCTTNPAYASKMLPTLPTEERDRILRDALERGSDIDDATDLVQCAIVARILPVFEALHREDPQGSGFVSIQGDPHKDSDVDHILRETGRYAGLGPNVIYKIPATAAGLRAAETLLTQGKPVIATAMFSVAQTRSACAV